MIGNVGAEIWSVGIVKLLKISGGIAVLGIVVIVAISSHQEGVLIEFCNHSEGMPVSTWYKKLNETDEIKLSHKFYMQKNGEWHGTVSAMDPFARCFITHNNQTIVKAIFRTG